jgi:hypothetical protein
MADRMDLTAEIELVDRLIDPRGSRGGVGVHHAGGSLERQAGGEEPAEEVRIVVRRVERQPGRPLVVRRQPLGHEHGLAHTGRAVHEDHRPVGVVVDDLLDPSTANGDRRHGRWRARVRTGARGGLGERA